VGDGDDSDVLVLGSGVAGLSLALRLAHRYRVSVLSKGALHDTSSWHAQGGVSAVLDEADSAASHVADTLEVGAGLCDPAVVRHVVARGAECVRWLADLGVDFTTAPAADGSLRYHLTREGGHSHRRVIHVADATGRAIQTALAERARRHPHIRLRESQLAVELVTGLRGERGPRPPGSTRPDAGCHGAYVLDPASGKVRVHRARCTVLATGGAGRVYLYTSNPDAATGDGLAMGWRAGCRVANMEFVQFHPTCLYDPRAKSFLVTEAVRGEGGVLRLPDGERFMPRFDARGELAPRDVVARAIDHEMKRLGLSFVHLDISHRRADFVREHFPNVHARCLELGLDMTAGPLPVVPAAHYTCGGLATDLHGRTDVPRLYAVGEVASTGLHGANRMASNSLLECLVFAESAAADLERRLPGLNAPPAVPVWDESRVTDSDEEVVVTHNWHELRRFMWDYVGIVRTTKRLERAARRVALLLEEIDEYYGNFRVSADLIELRNLALVADLIIRSALARRESRGLHFTLDHPGPDDSRPPQSTVLIPPAFSDQRPP